MPRASSSSARAAAQLVRAERGEENHVVAEPRELGGGDGPTACGFLPDLERVRDRPASGNLGHPDELAPLHVTDDRRLHAEVSHLDAPAR